MKILDYLEQNQLLISAGKFKSIEIRAWNEYTDKVGCEEVPSTKLNLIYGLGNSLKYLDDYDHEIVHREFDKLISYSETTLIIASKMKMK